MTHAGAWRAHIGQNGCMPIREHWDSVYEHKGPSQVSWYRPHLEHSLRFIEEAGLGRDAAIIVVGGGASTLVDDLIARRYRDVSVLDVSSKALESANPDSGNAGHRFTGSSPTSLRPSSLPTDTTSGTTETSSIFFEMRRADVVTSPRSDDP